MALCKKITRIENDFLQSPKPGEELHFMVQAEAIWALMWATGKVAKLDFTKPCSNSLVKMLPDLRANESPDGWRKSLKLRSNEEVVAGCDLAYRLHWAIKDALLHGRKLPTADPHSIIERRRALEWLLQGNEWDDVDLDT